MSNAESTSAQPDVSPSASDHASLRTKPYRILRSQLTWWTVREYVRGLWFMFIGIPISGLTMLFLPHPVFKMIGTMALAWPFTIPARAFLITSRAARRFTRQTVMAAEGQHLYFMTDNESSYRIALDSIRAIKARPDVFAVELKGLKFLFVPWSAFETDAQRLAFVNLKPNPYN